MLQARINGTMTDAPAGAVAWQYTTPLEDARWLSTVAEAEAIEREDASLIVWAEECHTITDLPGWTLAVYADGRAVVCSPGECTRSLGGRRAAHADIAEATRAARAMAEAMDAGRDHCCVAE